MIRGMSQNWFRRGRATMGVAGANALTAASIEKSMTNFMMGYTKPRRKM